MLNFKKTIFSLAALISVFAMSTAMASSSIPTLAPNVPLPVTGIPLSTCAGGFIDIGPDPVHFMGMDDSARLQEGTLAFGDVNVKITVIIVKGG